MEQGSLIGMLTITGLVINFIALVKIFIAQENRFTRLEVDMHYVKRALELTRRENDDSKD